MPEAVHQFEPRQVRAVNAALAARRPLLVRGEPGIGKSQLARAAAAALGRAFVSHTVDARTESRDLLWHFDAVARLAEAQLIGALRACPAEPATGTESERKDQPSSRHRDQLAIGAFCIPRALWWAFDWEDALTRPIRSACRAAATGRWRPANGCLILIDEIDKAEADVPNGLLEALGAGRFNPQGAPSRLPPRALRRSSLSPPTRSAPCRTPLCAAAWCCICACRRIPCGWRSV